MTADYDTLLDEPDDETCVAHGRALPCRICRMEDAEEREAAKREEGRDGFDSRA